MSGRTALVTGGIGRVGLAIVARLEADGMRVLVTTRSRERAEVFNAAREAEGSEARALVLKPESDESIRAFVTETVAAFGPISALVNNAYCQLPDRHVEDMGLDDWAEAARVDLGLAHRLSVDLVDGQAPGDLEAIVNVASIYGVMAPDFRIYTDGRIPSMITYGAMKAGLLQMTRYLAVYWAKRGVRVNAVTLGGVENGQAETFLAAYGAMVPTGRMISRTEAADAIAFLVSRGASGITGQNLVVDAGREAW